MKIVFNLPEDDPKNPGVIADCTGDNAGDSVGPTADGFETYGVTGVALIAFLALALFSAYVGDLNSADAFKKAFAEKQSVVCATLIIWLFVMRTLMIITSLVSYFLNEAISKAKFGGKKDFDFEAPLTHLVWITSAVSIGITFAASKLLLGDFSVPKEVLLEGAKRTEEQLTRFKELQRETEKYNADLAAQRAPERTVTTEPPQDDMNSALLEALRKPHEGETRVQGILTTIECSQKGGIVFQVRAGGRIFKLHTADFEHVDVTAFTTDVSGEINCGPRKTENSVIITYSPAKVGSKVDGEASALEFVPKTFVLK